jgi:pectate lyase
MRIQQHQMKSQLSMIPTSNRLGRALTAAALLFLLQTAPVFSAIFFVATNGLDSNTGTSNRPFATIMKAQSAASAGDTVYLRGGTYYLDNSNFTATNSPWAIVNNITKSGNNYLAYPGERPVFDFSNVRPTGWRVTAFLVTANNCVFQGFDMVGVQVTIQTSHTQSECFRIAGGSNNRFEQLRMHDGMANGWYLTSGASNLVLNCDAYNNKGLDSGSIGNTDGFGCHPSRGGKGNIIRGCRAWFNSDDNYDCINASERVTFDHCWALYAGYSTNFVYLGGDGNGIKGGGYGANGSALPNPIPRHVIQFCVSVRNRANGFDANYHVGGQDWFNNTSYRNNVNYNMHECLTDNVTRVSGYGHNMKNNLGYKGSTEVSNLNMTNSDVSFNYFTLSVTVATNDFSSLDESLLILPRQTNGDLPYIAFARLTNTSDCIDAGTNLGFAFHGAAPDLGAFEFGPTNAPSPTVVLVRTNLVFTASGWANQTNYLIASTNLTLPAAQWTRIGTNVSDLSGLCAFTNAIPPGVPQRFYRIGVP